LVRHVLNVGAGHISGDERPNERLDVARYPALIDGDGRLALRYAKTRYDQAGSRGFHVLVEHFRDGERLLRLTPLPLRISPSSRRANYLLGFRSRRFHGEWAIPTDL